MNTTLSIQNRILLLITLMLLLMMTACMPAEAFNGRDSGSVMLIISTPTPAINMSEVVETPQSVANGLSESESESGSDFVEADLRLGYLDRMNCQFFSELMAIALEQKQKMNILVVPYQTENDLFDALTEQKIDFTLCFVDPNDRSQIKPRLGHIRQIGSSYWENNEVKMQIWANTVSKADLRDKRPCILDFLEKLKLTEIEESDTDAKTWYQTNPVSTQEWLNCAP